MPLLGMVLTVVQLGVALMVLLLVVFVAVMVSAEWH